MRGAVFFLYAMILPMVIAYIILIGLCFGSFIGAFHWRLHEEKNFTTERSICEHCKHILAWYDLVPLVSWLSLHGKCRYCKKPIGFMAPALEIGTALLFMLSYISWPYELTDVAGWTVFILWLVILVGLITLFVYDIRWYLLPDKIVFPLIGVAMVSWIISFIVYDIPLIDAFGALAFGVFIGGGLFFALFQVSDGRWIGGGDVKLGFLIGIILGPFDAFIALLIGFYSASLIVLPLLATKRITRKTKIPFGPFLIFGLVVAQLYGETIHKLYMMYFGL